MKKITAILLATLMLLGCLSGCGDNTDPTTNKVNGSNASSSAAQTKYAYQASYIPLNTEAYDIRYISGMTAMDDRVVLLANCITGQEVMTNEATGEPYTDDDGEPLMQTTYENRLFVLNPETGEMQQLDYRPRKPEEGQYGYTYASGLTSMADGSIWFFDELSTYYYDIPEDFDSETDDYYQYYVDGGMSLMCYHYDAQGNVLNTVLLETTQDQYLSDVRFTEQGIYATDYSSIYRFDETGKMTQSLPLDGGMDGIVVLKEGLAISLWGESGYCVKPLDETTMTLGESIALPANVYNVMAGFGEYDYLYQNNGIFYGLKDGVSEQVLSWLDCDVDAADVNNYQFQEDGTVYAIESQYENDKTTHNLIVLHQVDAATLPERQVLTLACLNLPWDLRTEIIEFNKSQSDVRITVTDYSQYATADDGNAAGLQRLNNEILSGVVPDLFYITDDEFPVDVYAAKGILQDIWPLIDADPELSRDDLMTHFFDVLSTDGKLYQVTDSFYIDTVVGRSDVIGTDTSWTLEQMMETFETLEDGASLFGEMDTRENMFSTIVGQNINQFVDWSTGECTFQTQDFMDLLNLVKTFPETFDYENYDWSNYDSEGLRMRMRKQLVQQVSLWGFSDMQRYNTMCDGQSNYIGYPTTDGSGSRFGYSGGLAISTACRNTDAAWQFVRQFLTEDHQTSDYMFQFPTNRHSFEAYAEDSMTVKLEEDNMDYIMEAGIAMAETVSAKEEGSSETETGEHDGEMFRGTYYFSQGEYVNWYHMTQEEYDQFMALYEATNTVGFNNQGIYDIIWQECEAFFAGQKTVEETADLIQNRVSLYVAEQS